MTQTSGSLAIVGAHLRRNLPADDAAAAPTALLVRDGRIALLGDDASVRDAARAEGARVLDARGGTLTPGLVDSHTHPRWAVDLTAGVDLGGLTTPDALREALRREADRVGPDGWVRGWNMEYAVFDEVPFDRAVVEDVVGGRPTVLVCYDLHTALANEPAMRAGGITGPRDFADTSEVVVDADGRLTGELREMSAYRLVTDAEPPYRPSEEREAFRSMLSRLAATGLTGGAVMDGDARTCELLAELEEHDALTQRLVVHRWHAVHLDDAAAEAIVAASSARGRLWGSDAIKLFSDGVVDTGTAWLHEPDACGGGRHAFWPDWERFAQVVRRYHDAGLTIATHAVGDRAVAQVLEVYAALPRHAGSPTHSIEHLEVMGDAEVALLAASGVVASMQPLHMQWRAEDGSDSWAERLGDARSAHGFRARSVLESGARLVLGSDWPVASHDPRVGMAWARGRSRPGARGAVFEPEERLTGEEALLGYTRWPALARGHDDRGVLRIGAVGDLTLWAEDPVAVTADDLVELPVLATVVDGRVVHG